MRGLFALASTVGIAAAMLAAAQPALALSSIDGQWTVSHGGTGQVSLNVDGTYTSTCVVYANYEDAWCPPPSGTFQEITMGSDGVIFTGADGSTATYRVSGNVYTPDTITSYFGSRTNSPLVMKKGSEFVCTDWYLPIRIGATNPLVTRDAVTGDLYLTGSHQLVTTGDVAETAPNYFQNGSCDDFTPAVHIDSLVDTTVSSAPGTWAPQVTVTFKDRAGVPASGVAVMASFSDSTGDDDNAYYYQDLQCVTAADGTCTLGGVAITTTTMRTLDFNVWSASKVGSLWLEGNQSLTLTNNLALPVSSTHHVGDLDNATASLSSLSAARSLKAVSSAKWQPGVAATVLDANGKAVTGATVSGAFSNHKGTLTCVTAANGICTLGNFSLSRSTSSTVFKVTGVVKAFSTYTPKANSDPDGDSNGTTITVKRP